MKRLFGLVAVIVTVLYAPAQRTTHKPDTLQQLSTPLPPSEQLKPFRLSAALKMNDAEKDFNSRIRALQYAKGLSPMEKDRIIRNIRLRRMRQRQNNPAEQAAYRPPFTLHF